MRLYPSRNVLLKISDAAEKWAKTIRNNWPLRDATPQENPFQLFATPCGLPSNLEKKRVARPLLNIGVATGELNRAVNDIEPGDPFDGLPKVGKLRRRYPREPATDKTVSGWPFDVSRAITILKAANATIDRAMSPPMKPMRLSEVQRVEWAVGVLREAVKRKGGQRAQRNREPLDPKKLTGKQLEASQIVAECKGNFAEAARRLGKDPKTVRQHYNAAMKKLGKTVVKHKTKQLPSDRRGQANIAEGQDRRR